MEGEHRKRGRLRTPILTPEQRSGMARDEVTGGAGPPVNAPLSASFFSFSPVDPSQRTESGSIQGVRECFGRGGLPLT